MDWEEQNDDIHTPENPYCGDPACWCHTSVEYHDLATSLYTTEEEVDWFYQFLELAR